MLEGGHVRDNMLYERMPARTPAALDLVSMLIADAMVPALLLAGLYIAFLLVLGRLRPDCLPAIPAAKRGEIRGVALAGEAVRALAPPLLLVGGVLASIIGGFAAPTEAAGMGAAISIAVAA